jgi:hypothetical protein
VDVGVQVGQKLGHDGRRAADIHPADDVDDAHQVEQITSLSSAARTRLKVAGGGSTIARSRSPL